MKKYNQSFANRLTRKVMLNVLATMFIIVSIIFAIAYRALKSEANGRYEAIMHLVNEKLARILASEEISARNLFDEVYYSLDSPELVMKALEKEIKLNNYTQGYFMAFEPGYFPEYEKWFEPYMNKNDEHPRNIGSPTHDYFTKDWYIESKKSEFGIWSDPYYDDVGAFANICSLTMPIYDKRDSIVGVCGVDLSLDWLVNELQDIDLNSIKPEHVPLFSESDTRIHSFIINRDGTYLAHPDKERVMNKNVLAYINQHDVDDMDLYTQMMQLKRGQTTLVLDGELVTAYYAPLESTNWSMAIVVPQRVFIYRALMLVGLLVVFSIIGLAIIYFLCRSNIRQVVKPLRALARSTEEVAQGNFDTPLPAINHQDEVCELRDSFATMQQSLEKYIEDIKQNTAREAAHNHDLEVAMKIQQAMLPSRFPPFPKRSDIDIFGFLKPAKSIGSDLYDFFIRDEKLFFCVADVCDKGVPAALFMMETRTLFRGYAANDNRPDRIVSKINKSLNENNESLMFVTLFVGILDLEKGVLSYCSAGHEGPFLINKDITILPSEGDIPVGVIADTRYMMREIQIEPQTTILGYTDGLYKAMMANQVKLVNDPVLDEVTRALQDGQTGPKELIERLKQNISNHLGDAEQGDDITMLAIRIS